MPTHFIFIGDPGNGKATLLNILCNRNCFTSWYARGPDSTAVLDYRTFDAITYIDTPGVNANDLQKRYKACAEIAALLKGGGGFKVIFVLGSS